MKHKSQWVFLLLALAAPAAIAGAHHKSDEASSKEQLKGYQAQSPQVKKADFEALLTYPEQLLIIDLRNPHEIATNGGFSAYLNIQFDQLQEQLAFIPKDRTIVTVSNHGGRSGRAADLLASKGYQVAGWLGAQYYEEEGGQLVKAAQSKAVAQK